MRAARRDPRARDFRRNDARILPGVCYTGPRLRGRGSHPLRSTALVEEQIPGPRRLATWVIAMNGFRVAARSAACLAIVVAATVARGDVFDASPGQERAARHGEAGTGWIVDRADNICGLDDAKMLSKPAKVDYDALLRATPEMKKIKDDKIDPSSPQGIQLRQAAATRVQKAADKVRSTEGYCSVWKSIRHQDGRAIPDVTDAVKAQL